MKCNTLECELDDALALIRKGALAGGLVPWDMTGYKGKGRRAFIPELTKDPDAGAPPR
jgi:hypothetical protein